MALTVNLPSAGLLGISGADTFQVTADTTLEAGNVYVLQGTSAYSLTMPSTSTDGDTILLKKVGNDETITINSALFDGTTQTIEITNSQPIRLVFISGTFGWLIT